MKLCAALFAAALPMIAPAGAAEPPRSFTEYRCYICHADHEVVVGPAFVDIATAYRGERDAIARIARSIRSGIKGGGPWHMPPHPEISPQDARTMARYIMSLAPRRAPGAEKNVIPATTNSTGEVRNGTANR